MDPLRKLIPGERLPAIPAVAWNEFLDTAKWSKQYRQHTGVPSSANDRPLDFIRVKNTTANALPQFSVLGVGETILTPAVAENLFKVNVWYNGELPSEPKHNGRFCVILEPLAVNGIGFAAVSGQVPVKLADDNAAKFYEFAEISNGVTASLRACSRGGARILWRDSTGNPRWAVVCLDAWQQPDYPFGSEAVVSGAGTSAADKVWIREGRVFAVDGTGTVSEYLENVAASTWYYVQYTLKFDHSAPTITTTIQTAGSEPTWASATTGGIIFKWVVCQTDSNKRIVWRWVGGDIHAPQIDADTTWDIHFRGKVAGNVVNVATGTIMCYEQKWVIPKKDSISLLTDADVYVEWDSYPAKTQTFHAPTVITVDVATTWDRYAKQTSTTLYFKLLIGRIRSGAWEQCYWGDLNASSSMFQPSIPVDVRCTYETDGKYVMHQSHTDVGLEGEEFFKGGWVMHRWEGGNLIEVGDKTLMRWGGKTCDNDLSYVDGLSLSHTTSGCSIAYTKQKWQFETTKGLVQKCELASDTGGSLSMTEVTVLTALQYDSSAHQLQVKKRVIHVPCADAEGAWESAFQAVSQTVLVSVSLGGGFLCFGTKILWVFEIEAGSNACVETDDCD